MDLLLNDLVVVTILTEDFQVTTAQGRITALGIVAPDILWFEVAGMTNRFYTDACEVEKIA